MTEDNDFQLLTLFRVHHTDSESKSQLKHLLTQHNNAFTHSTGKAGFNTFRYDTVYH